MSPPVFFTALAVILCYLCYKLGVALEREKWIYHLHFLERGVAKCYRNGKVDLL
jgi:hypothetical protein